MHQHHIDKGTPRAEGRIFIARPSGQTRLTGNLQHIRHIGAIGIINRRLHHHLLFEHAGAGLFDIFTEAVEPRILVNARFQRDPQNRMPIGGLAGMTNAIAQALLYRPDPFVER